VVISGQAFVEAKAWLCAFTIVAANFVHLFLYQLLLIEEIRPACFRSSAASQFLDDLMWTGSAFGFTPAQAGAWRVPSWKAASG
jgi:hypothetical protein